MTSNEQSRQAKVRAALEAQRALAHALKRAGGPDEWIHLDLTMGQLKALLALTDTDPINVSGLAERLEISKPTASILVDRLVQLGYVERTEDVEDRRRTLVTPTTKGRELVAALRQSGDERLARWVEQMDPGDLDALIRGLRALAAVAAREAPAAPGVTAGTTIGRGIATVQE